MKIPVDEVALFGAKNLYTIRVPKEIAKISICNAVTFTITDDMSFTRPTEEQIKNLQDVFCIEVKLLDENE